MKKPAIEPNTYHYHEQNVRLYIVPTLGKTALAKIRPAHVASMYKALTEREISPATQKHAGITLSTVLNDAVKMNLIGINPARAVKKPKASKPDIRPLDKPQVKTFLKATSTDRLHSCYLLAIDSGMRQGELFGLHWTEVDWSAGAVSVMRFLEEKNGKLRLKDVKTDSSGRRRIRLSPETIAALNRYRQEQLAKGLYDPAGPVFTDTEGGFLRKPNFYRYSFLKAMKKAKIEGVRFHDLRHTCATLLLLAGVNIKVVSARLGHSKITTNLDTYSHILPAMDDQIIGVMSGALRTGTEG